MTNPFHFSTGQDAFTTQQLQEILSQVDDESVVEHVQQGHFASWVEHELDNKHLADRLRHCTTVDQVLDVLHLENTPKPQRKPAKQHEEMVSHAEQIKELKKKAQNTFAAHNKPQPVVTNKNRVSRPQPITNESRVEKYNAKEFVLGLMIGIVLGVLIYALLGALA